MKKQTKTVLKSLAAIFMVITLSAVLVVSCAKKEEPPATSEETLASGTKVTKTKTTFQRKAGTVTTYICYTGTGPFTSSCCAPPILIEICGYETRDASTNQFIDFNITSVRQIVGNCMSTCPSEEIVKIARQMLVRFLVDNEGDIEHETGKCMFEGTRTYKVKTPQCWKNVNLNSPEWKVSCDETAYCESTMIATCINGTLTVISDPNNPPVPVGNCITPPGCIPVLCMP